jgi:hypothetical protein
MNWNPESVDNFKVDVWSDSDAGGPSQLDGYIYAGATSGRTINSTYQYGPMTEIAPDAGIFEAVCHW